MRCAKCGGLCVEVTLRDLVTDERCRALQCLLCSMYDFAPDAQPFPTYQHQAAPEPLCCEGAA